MTTGAGPWAFGGAIAALLGVALVVMVRARWLGWRRARRCRRGHEGERSAAALLERAGWRVLERHPAAMLPMLIDGERVTQPLCADYLCVRFGRVLPVEVKTGDAADPRGRGTRRQLLEYAVAYGSDATLFVDADRGTVQEVAFGRAARARPGPVMLALVVGALAGLAGGGWVFLSRPSQPTKPPASTAAPATPRSSATAPSTTAPGRAAP